MDTIKRTKFKSYFLFFIICSFFLAIGTRLFYLQVYNRDYYVQYSNKQFIRKVKVYPNRGQIYDRHMNPLALNVQNYNIFIMPKEVKDLGTTTYELGKILPGIEYRKLYKKIKARNKFTWIKRNIEISEDHLKKIQSFKGVYIEPVWGRLYPNKTLASQVLGFVNIDNKGLAGLEFAFDKELAGVEKTLSYVRDAKGRALKFETETNSSEPRDLVLSIDKEIQSIAETHLKEAVIKHEAKSGGIGVMDARTGEIWALANYPTYDPNLPGESIPENRKLSFISDPFEPGSVSKTHTISMALESKKVNLNTVFDCENGVMDIGPDKVRESAGHKYKLLSVEDILSLSSNIGSSKVAFELGDALMLEGLKSFGYGEKTNIELPSESKGIFKLDKKLKKIKLSNISFGQGLAATGIQILRSYAPFANGGFWVDPTILKKEKNDKSDHRLLNEKTLNDVLKAMKKVVNEGTGNRAKISNFQIAGKTGTAQKPAKGKGYLKDEYIASFAGFPIGAEKPFVVFVYVDASKKGGYYGNEVAAPIFKKVTERILIKNNEMKSLATVKGEDSKDVLRVVQASVKRRSSNKVPNFVGLDEQTVKSLAIKSRVDVEIIGRGIVTKQIPEAFSDNTNEKIKVILKIPDYE